MEKSNDATQFSSANDGTATEPTIDPAKLEDLLEKLRAEQNLGAGAAAGAGAALLSSVVWALISDATGYQIAFMAIGVGVFVGIAVRTFGKGIDKNFGITGTILALLGCAVGNLLTACIAYAEYLGLSFGEVVADLNLEMISAMMEVTFHPMDILFYAFAGYYGYKLAFRKLTEEMESSISNSTV